MLRDRFIERAVRFVRLFSSSPEGDVVRVFPSFHLFRYVCMDAAFITVLSFSLDIAIFLRYRVYFISSDHDLLHGLLLMSVA